MSNMAENLQVFAFFESKGARFVIIPACLQSIMAMIHTTDYTRLDLHGQLRIWRETYLYGQVEEIQIPVRARDTIFIRDGHRYRSQTVRQDRYARAVRNIRGYGDHTLARGGPRRDKRIPDRRWGRPSAEISHLNVWHLDGIVFVLLVLHDRCNSEFCSRRGRFRDLDTQAVVEAGCGKSKR